MQHRLCSTEASRVHSCPPSDTRSVYFPFGWHLIRLNEPLGRYEPVSSSLSEVTLRSLRNLLIIDRSSKKSNTLIAVHKCLKTINKEQPACASELAATQTGFGPPSVYADNIADADNECQPGETCDVLATSRTFTHPCLPLWLNQSMTQSCS